MFGWKKEAAAVPRVVTPGEMQSLVERCVRTKADADYDELYDGLFRFQLFVNMDFKPDGSPATMGKTMLGEQAVVMFFLSNRSKYLKLPYGGMTWDEVLRMVGRMQEGAGVQISNERDDWVVFLKPYLEQRAAAARAGGMRE